MYHFLHIVNAHWAEKFLRILALTAFAGFDFEEICLSKILTVHNVNYMQ